jgi:type VI secretion system secreted protein VgrG
MKQKKERLVTGYITYVEKIQDYSSTTAIFEIKVESWLSILDRNSDSRVFIDQTISEIAQTIMKKYEANMPQNTIKFVGDAGTKKVKTCVQYHESDSHFLCRILEENSLFFFFQHTPDKLILCVCPHQGGYIYDESLDVIQSQVPSFSLKKHISSEVKPGKIVHSNYASQFHDSINTTESIILSNRTPKSMLDLITYKHYETSHSENSPHQEIEILKSIIESQENMATGHTLDLNFAPGKSFTVKNDLPTKKPESFAITGVHVSIFDGLFLREGDREGTVEFSCITSTTVFKSQYYTKPQAMGLHRAVVVGEKEGSVEANKNHAVFVRFNWDRYAQKEPLKNKYPAAVSQMWAGKEHGAVYLPHVGDEVFVSFLNGNLEEGVIVGSAFSAKNPPKVSKENNPAVHVLYTAGNNQLLFDDSKGKERLELHAQKDYTVKTKNKAVLEQKELSLVAQESVQISLGAISVTIDKSGLINICDSLKIQVSPGGSAIISSSVPLIIDAQTVFSKPIQAPNVK